MKIIIEHGKTKREIDGPFNLCGSREDLENLVDQLRSKLADARWSYGWINVVTARQPSLTNTSPIPWEAP